MPVKKTFTLDVPGAVLTYDVREAETPTDEPPLDDLLPDREQLRAAMRDVHETYMAKGFGHGMAKFITLVMHEGEVTDDYLTQPDPDPAMFGLPAEDDGSRDDPLMGVNMDTLPGFELNTDGINAAPTRVAICVGEESEQVMTGRASYAVAEALGQEATVFPGGHNGFMGGEYGQPPGKPVEFAAKLREVLAGR